MQTLKDQAELMVDVSARSNLTYEELNEYQREQLTAKAIKEFSCKSEIIEDVVCADGLYEKLIEALEETHYADRNVLLKEIGQMLLEGAIARCKDIVIDSLDEAQTRLRICRQFTSEINFNLDSERADYLNADNQTDEIKNILFGRY